MCIRDRGKHIQQYRFELDKTQEEIAEKANISKNYLSKIETGKSAGRLDVYKRQDNIHPLPLEFPPTNAASESFTMVPFLS